MTIEEKKAKIELLANEMLKCSIENIQKSIKRAIECSGVDIESWDENSGPMILPKTILVATIENEARQYYGRGTSFERQIKKDVANIKMFI